ncbi:MAG: ABC transporter permease [Chloroflexi bacterium]|nr:MAG: ABC transporter permease [Chloroflexota bacterium]
MSLLAGDLRAFFAAALKEVRQQRRYPTIFLGQLFWPVILPASWVLMGQAYSGNNAQALAAFAERAGSSNVAVFVFVGYAMYNWLSVLLWGAGTALRQEQLRGTLEAVFVTPASRLVPLFGPGVATLLPMAVIFASNLLALRVFFGVLPPVAAVLQAAVIVVLGIPALYAIGALFAASVLRFGEVAPVVQLIRGMFVLACGITFPLAMLPLWAQIWAKLMPPTYIVDDIRRVLLRGDTIADVAGDVAIVLSLAVLTAVLAVAVFRYLERSARVTGMLGRF